VTTASLLIAIVAVLSPAYVAVNAGTVFVTTLYLPHGVRTTETETVAATSSAETIQTESATPQQSPAVESNCPWSQELPCGVGLIEAGEIMRVNKTTVLFQGIGTYNGMQYTVYGMLDRRSPASAPIFSGHIEGPRVCVTGYVEFTSVPYLTGLYQTQYPPPMIWLTSVYSGDCSGNLGSVP
jgi:hypothetical protein